MGISRALRILEIVALLLPLMAILLQASTRVYAGRDAPARNEMTVRAVVVTGMQLVALAGMVAVLTAVFSGVSWQIAAALLLLYGGLLAVMGAGMGLYADLVLEDQQAQQTLSTWTPNDRDDDGAP